MLPQLGLRARDAEAEEAEGGLDHDRDPDAPMRANVISSGRCSARRGGRGSSSPAPRELARRRSSARGACSVCARASRAKAGMLKKAIA